NPGAVRRRHKVESCRACARNKSTLWSSGNRCRAVALEENFQHVLRCQFPFWDREEMSLRKAKPRRAPNKRRRRRSIIGFEMIRLNRSAAEPLHQQLYRQIRDELVSGSFGRNASRLPSSRALAMDLGISRLTVNLAFSKLHEEGYLQSKVGSGTFVAESLPETYLS